MVKNIILEIAYDGSAFSGYQVQNDLRTVEGEIRKALRKVTGEKNRVIACGRTDSGVHARRSYLNFLTASDINPKAFFFHMQPELPDDILAISSKEASLNFHARFDAKSKTYRYIINQSKTMHPVYRNYMAHVSYRLDYDKLKQGLEILKGDHDFRLFMKDDANFDINTNRRIDEAYYEKSGDILSIYFKADSFLHNQVRIMTGSLIELARGRISLSDFKNYCNKDCSKRANPALSPKGLYLWEVEY